ncbi:MAG TPA: hypothetical protein VF476_10275 [Chitinophagaceae bacterium]
MRRLILITGLLLPILTFSQQKQKSSRPLFQPSTSFAVLVGESAPSWQVQANGGFRLGQWYAGLGTAVDNYRFRSIPLYASVRRHYLFRKALFAYADAGVAFPWKRKVVDEGFTLEQQQFYTGFYSETGIGYQLPSKGKLTVNVSAGYSFRTMKQRVVTPMLWSSAWPMPEYEVVKEHKFHLLTFRTIIGFAGK